ncbi:hypothetical protein PVAG01_10986 [Phlyctema vagabunda]|uniref:Uncharacterized protein n=1 Tax=Phlyctema vagabunda TaxID=108571 RepID=A0ABR4P3T5_9HELO
MHAFLRYGGQGLVGEEVKGVEGELGDGASVPSSTHIDILACMYVCMHAPCTCTVVYMTDTLRVQHAFVSLHAWGPSSVGLCDRQEEEGPALDQSILIHTVLYCTYEGSGSLLFYPLSLLLVNR